MKKTVEERTIVKFLPERGWVANKHIGKQTYRENPSTKNCALEKKKIYKVKSAKKKKEKKLCDLRIPHLFPFTCKDQCE